MSRVAAEAGSEIWRRLGALYLVLIAFNIGAWTWAVLVFHDRPVLLATALVAYGFGLRHAVDADHIAAIDNVTRKQMQQGERPITIGFFFSLGHSTVVILASLIVAFAATALESHFGAFKSVGSLIGTSISAIFLFAIAAMNLVILVQVYRAFQSVECGTDVPDELENLLSQSGFFARIFRRPFRLVAKSWHMFPLGFLFGLGFDTASEIAVLGISAAEATKGISIWSIMVFPALFTAGMSLVDTTDGVLMLGAYGWAFVHPVRKLFYNVSITLISAMIAIVIGSIELLGLFGDRLALKGAFWSFLAQLNDHFGALGYGIIGFFVMCWAGSVALWRRKTYDKLGLEP